MRRSLVPILFPGFSIARLLQRAPGFYFDFTANATGAGIASVTSQPPSTKTAVQATGSKQPVWTDAGVDYALYDGIDDELRSDLVPGPEITLGFCGRMASANSVAVGSNTAGNNRGGFVGMNASSQIAGGWGAQGLTTICFGASIANTDVAGVIRCSMSRVALALNGVTGYDQPADISTAPNTTVPYDVGAINASGTPTGFFNGRLYRAFAVQSFINDSQALQLARALGQGIVNI